MSPLKYMSKILTRNIKTISRSSKQVYPAATRNSEPILQVLRKVLDGTTPGRLLEVSSGTGQHALHFGDAYPNITFQPTEYERSLLPSISAYAAESQFGNIKEPLHLDIAQEMCLNGEEGQFDYVVNINMLHVSPWACAQGLFRNSGRLLKPGGLLLIYGAMAIDGVVEPESNRQFDKSIRRQNREWGIRDLRDLRKEAAKNGISLRDMHDMPANNKMLIWEKS